MGMRRRRGASPAHRERGATREKVRFARELRRASTPGEAALWAALRTRSLGWKFRRQHVIAGFIVDFYCAALSLAIEIDGGVHDAQREYDEARDCELFALGVVVVRFREAYVVGDIGRALEDVEHICAKIARRR